MFWYADEWPICNDCSEVQIRSVQCKSINVYGIINTVPDDRCSPTNRPPSSQLCLNDQLQCVHSIHDNELDEYARKLFQRYNGLDKAEQLRNLIPRICGPNELSIYDESATTYITCTIMLAIPGLIGFLCAIIFLLTYCCCEQSCWQSYCNTPRKEGYNFKQRCLPFVYITIIGLILSCFAAMGAFFNGEIRRAWQDQTTGIDTSINTFK